jgi:predicted esterase
MNRDTPDPRHAISSAKRALKRRCLGLEALESRALFAAGALDTSLSSSGAVLIATKSGSGANPEAVAIQYSTQDDRKTVLESGRLLGHLPGEALSAKVSIAARSPTSKGQTLDQSDAVVYLPAGLPQGGRVPLAVAFTPVSSLFNHTLANWEAVAARLHWVVYVSKDPILPLSAMSDFDQVAATIESSVDDAITNLPVDSSRVVLAGFSAGGYMAEYLDARYPGLAAALVVDANGYYAYGDDPDLPLSAGSGRPAAFLFSPMDDRFGPATRADRAFYQERGWSTLLLSYPGGHIDAPTAQYLRAASWIAAQPAWRA